MPTLKDLQNTSHIHPAYTRFLKSMKDGLTQSGRQLELLKAVSRETNIGDLIKVLWSGNRTKGVLEGEYYGLGARSNSFESDYGNQHIFSVTTIKIMTEDGKKEIPYNFIDNFRNKTKRKTYKII